IVLSRPWTRPLDRVADLPMLPPAEAALVRRRALLLPYFLAGLNFTGWVLAGVAWGLAFPLMAGTFEPSSSLRLIFGTTVIAGGVTVAFIFFASEHHWRRRLPEFFPEGNLSAVPGVPRLAVRVRLLAIFLLTGVVPLAVLGVLAYTQALELRGADPAAAAEIVNGLRLSIVFLLAVGGAGGIRPLPRRGQRRARAAEGRGGRHGSGGARPPRRPRAGGDYRRDRRGRRGLQPDAAG